MRLTTYHDPPYSPICFGCNNPGPHCGFYTSACPKPSDDSDFDKEEDFDFNNEEEFDINE